MPVPTLDKVQEDRDESETSMSGGHYGIDDPKSEASPIEKRENRLVCCSKMLVLLVIVTVAVGMGLITHSFVKSQQQADYVSHFREASTSLADVSQNRVREIYENLEAFSAMVTTFATNADAKWPFVEFSDFQVHAAVSNAITGAATMSLVPIVKHQDREQWEYFSVNASKRWLAAGHAYDKEVNEALYVDTRHNSSVLEAPESAFPRWDEAPVIPFIWKSENDTIVPVEDADVYYPAWLAAPSPDYAPFINIELRNFPYFSRVIEGMLQTDRPVLTEVDDGSLLSISYDNRFSRLEQEEPHSYLMQPIYDSLKKEREPVAILMAFFRWGNFFEKVLPVHEEGIIIVVYGTCNQTFSYEMVAGKPTFLGNEDFHDRDYDDMGKDFEIAPFNLAQTDDKKYCQYNARIFPSDLFKDEHLSNDPVYFAMAAVACFVLTSLVFVIYDCLVSMRQKRISEQAAKTTKIVNAMYPVNVRQRLMDEASSDSNQFKHSEGTAERSSFQGCNNGIYRSKPIADLFPEATILFADLVGFTAWSSVREPTQVFQLLETIYFHFDSAAQKMRIFKVETIGDCYVAACGLPMKRKDHAVVMARFAAKLLETLPSVLQMLECTLGPETSSLAIRVGLHSGPVTAGVLRGDKGRFQLFGDTVNTASRMESTGERGAIQVSDDTAKLLVAVGKERWLSERKDPVHAKGKGVLRTFWLRVGDGSIASGSYARGSQASSSDENSPVLVPSFENDGLPKKPRNAKKKKIAPKSSKADRLVQWNADLLARHLKEIQAQRLISVKQLGTTKQRIAVHETYCGKTNILEEVKDVLELSAHSPSRGSTLQTLDAESIDLTPEVREQLVDYVRTIADLYHDHPFHNWEHASHCSMSIVKLMGRIVHPTDIDSLTCDDTAFATLFQDPLIQFSCVFAGLVHDVDHSGESNATLIKIGHPLAAQYNFKSVAEQNSLDLCWKLLMQPKYGALQEAIFDNCQDELERFRALLVQCVMSTDIQDADLGAKRKARWEKAFAEDSSQAAKEEDTTLTKATIVLEHLMQASDVAHTMQHWHVFRKFNQRLFEEVYGSYLEEQANITDPTAFAATKDPSKFWYQGELGFFDHYILPLADKLETCGVFGVSSTEYKLYAEENRREWQEKGEALVEEYVATALEKRRKKKEAESKVEEEVKKEQVWTPEGTATDYSWA